MTTRRPTLRDRNREAIATPPTPLQADDAETAASATPRKTTAVRPGSTDKAVLSITVRPEDLEGAKAAYMSDWAREGRYDGFPKWLGAAIREHARLTPAQRAAIEDRRPPKATSRGLKRAFQMDPGDVQLMRDSIRQDLEEEGHYYSEADWCGDALRAAISAARQRAGGTLPRPPARLPNRMPERS